MHHFIIIVEVLALNLVGGTLMYWLIECLWEAYFDNHPDDSDKKRKLRSPGLTFGVGFVERLLYTLALYAGAWQWVGLWLGIKVAIRWRNKTELPEGASENIWLLGTSLSLLISFVCAWLALGHLPRYPSH